jgi:AcrR family transcriptional regulator
VPRLWTDTVAGHRRAVRDAALDAVAALVARRGLRGVTMSQIAEDAGIGRATLYKYFPDVDALITAWHERQVAAHLDRLAAARDQAGEVSERLAAVLQTYAEIAREPHGRHSVELAASVHASAHVARAHGHLRRLIHEVLADAAAFGHVRDDVGVEELVGYCLHALSAAAELASEVAVQRLVAVTLAGLRPANEVRTAGDVDHCIQNQRRVSEAAAGRLPGSGRDRARHGSRRGTAPR